MSSRQGELGQFGLWDAVVTLLAHWRAVALSIGAGVVVALAVWWIYPSTYRGEVVVVAATDSTRTTSGLADRLTGLASFAGLNLPAVGGSSSENLAFLRSRSLAEQFVREKDLLPRLYPKSWDNVTKKWRVGGSAQIPSIARGVQRFEKLLQIVEDKKAGTIRVSTVSVEPQLAASWANEFVAMANAELRQRAIRDADKTTAYLAAPINRPETGVELRAALVRVLEDQIKIAALANARDEFAFKVIDPAAVPERWQTSSPDAAISALSGALLGLLVAIAWVFKKAVKVGGASQ